ncbi:MAG: hypothetical protein AAF184_14775 [Pseudomonadota bacterium]
MLSKHTVIAALTSLCVCLVGVSPAEQRTEPVERSAPSAQTAPPRPPPVVLHQQRWPPDRPKRPATLRRVREENISDEEVREIRAVMLSHFPGAIVNIGAVTEGCHCADGPACENQVWVVADRNQVSNGLRLSRIGGVWLIGPVQEWWLEYEAYQQRLLEARKIRDREERGRRYQALTEEQRQLESWSPQCDDPRQAYQDSRRY